MRKLFVPIFALLLALAFGAAVMAQSADDKDSFEVSVTNPYVQWDDAFTPDALDVTVEPGMDRQYSVTNSFTVASTTPFAIEVAAEWTLGRDEIDVNPDNAAIGAEVNINNVFDIQISSRGDIGDYSTYPALSAPAAGTKTAAGQDNTLAVEPDDAVQYGVTVTLVLVDEQNKLPGDYNTSGWDSGGLDNRRFDSLPAGDYEVDVTVTISEDV